MNTWPCFIPGALVIAAAAAVAVEPATILLVDDHDVLYRSGTRRVLHQPQRFAGNPVMVGATLKNQVGYCSVHRDAATGRYRMWYQLGSGTRAVCYAESDDGLKWTKPELGLIALKGFDEPNIVFTSSDHYGASVVIDPPGGDPARRYKMAYYSIPPREGATKGEHDPRGPNGGMYVAFSPDGLHWIAQAGPALRGSYGRSSDPPLVGERPALGESTSVSDVIDAAFDPLRKKYVIYAKGWIDGPDGTTFWKRDIVRTESEDFLHWSPPQIVMAPDENDGVHPADFPGTRRGVQLHAAPTFVRHGIYFALLQVADFETNGLQPIELAISRDGLAWLRPFRNTPFLPVGENGTFDAGRIWTNATPIVLEDEIRFYYGAYESPWQFGKGEYPWGAKTRLPKTGIGLATLPLDRFAGVRPIEKTAQITFRPRSLAGAKGLTLNADASAGTIRVELLDSAGHRFRDFTKADAMPISGDGLRHRVTWKNADLSKMPAQEVMIRIHLDNAEVFALTIE